ncbi:hypothetical protein ACFSBJ_13125 [Haloplanus ruber]|uniref:Uncharacterized protein n=2 Tax=Haloplanus ruber TaxID=869892 RepID=A0ABD6D166_9EURY
MTRGERLGGTDAVVEECDDRMLADGARAAGGATVRRVTGRNCSMRSNPANLTWCQTSLYI